MAWAGLLLWEFFQARVEGNQTRGEALRQGRVVPRLTGLTLSQSPQAAARPEPALFAPEGGPSCPVRCQGDLGVWRLGSWESLPPGAPGLELLPRTLKTPPENWCLSLPRWEPDILPAQHPPSQNSRRVNSEVEDPTRRRSRLALPSRTFYDDVNVPYLPRSIWQPRVPTAERVSSSPPPPPLRPPWRHCILHKFLH